MNDRKNTEFKHTPEPWTISDNVDFDSFISGNTGKFENVICTSPRSWRRGKGGCKNYKPWHDNKHLIAAAPEMLPIIIRIFEDFCHYRCNVKSGKQGCDSICESKYKIQSVIEKATNMTIQEVLDIVSTRRANANP